MIGWLRTSCVSGGRGTVLNCRDLLAELGNYLDDQVAAELRQELEIHLEHCHTCQVLADSTRKTLRIITNSRCFELPMDISGRIMAKIRDSRKEP